MFKSRPPTKRMPHGVFGPLRSSSIRKLRGGFMAILSKCLLIRTCFLLYDLVTTAILHTTIPCTISHSPQLILSADAQYSLDLIELTPKRNCLRDSFGEQLIFALASNKIERSHDFKIVQVKWVWCFGFFFLYLLLC